MHCKLNLFIKKTVLSVMKVFDFKQYKIDRQTDIDTK